MDGSASARVRQHRGASSLAAQVPQVAKGTYHPLHICLWCHVVLLLLHCGVVWRGRWAGGCIDGRCLRDRLGIDAFSFCPPCGYGGSSTRAASFSVKCRRLSYMLSFSLMKLPRTRSSCPPIRKMRCCVYVTHTRARKQVALCANVSRPCLAELLLVTTTTCVV